MRRWWWVPPVAACVLCLAYFAWLAFDVLQVIRRFH